MRGEEPLVIRVDCGSASEDLTGLKPESSGSDRGFCFASNKKDVVVVHPDDAYCVQWLLEHHRKAGLVHGRHVIGDNHRLLDELPDNYGVMTYLYDDWALNFRPNAQRYVITEQMRSKIKFTGFCQQLGITTPNSWGFISKKSCHDFAQFSYPCWFKPDLGFTGRGVTKVSSEVEMRSIMESVPGKMPFQIQAHLEQAVAFPNVTYFCHAGKAHRVMVTGQILAGKSGQDHIGNYFADNDEFDGVWAITDDVANAMAVNGMEFIIGLDVAKCVASDGSIYYVMIECNPRPNGSSFPTKLVKRLLGSQTASPWLAVTVPTSCRSFSDLQLDDLIFNGREGLIVHEASRLNSGKLGITFLAPTFAEVNVLRQMATERLA